MKDVVFDFQPCSAFYKLKLEIKLKNFLNKIGMSIADIKVSSKDAWEKSFKKITFYKGVHKEDIVRVFLSTLVNLLSKVYSTC